MLDNATYTPRLKSEYASKIRAAMKEEFSYKNDMQIPRLDKLQCHVSATSAAYLVNLLTGAATMPPA